VRRMENWEVESFIVEDVVGRRMEVWGSFVSVRRAFEGFEKIEP
jgi:hypothetical protein